MRIRIQTHIQIRIQIQTQIQIQIFLVATSRPVHNPLNVQFDHITNTNTWLVQIQIQMSLFMKVFHHQDSVFLF